MKRRDFSKIMAAAGAGAMLPWHKLRAVPAAAGLSDPALQPKFANPVPDALNPGFIYQPDKKDENVEETTNDEQETVTLRGRIVRVIPQEDGGAQLTIVGVGRADGLATGMTGTIIGCGKKFRVTTVTKRGALAMTQAEAEEVKPYHNVVIKVKR